MPPKQKTGAVVASAKELMNLRPKVAPVPLLKKKRRTSAEVAADKAAKELVKKQKADAITAKVLMISRKENMMAAEDRVADAQANHPPANLRTKTVRRVTLVVTKPTAASNALQEGGKSKYSFTLLISYSPSTKS
jgi:hypothetical protein